MRRVVERVGEEGSEEVEGVGGRRWQGGAGWLREVKEESERGFVCVDTARRRHCHV